MGKTTRLMALAVLLLFAYYNNSGAQYINAPGGDDEEYQNYADEGYKNYSQEFLTLKHYDNFGNFLLEGLNVYNLSDPHPASTAGLLKERVYTNWFENLVLVQDQYKGFSTSIMVGDAIRTKFTSLTLDRARFNGVRWDGATAKNRLTLVYSRVSDPLFAPFKQQLTSRLTAEHTWNRFLYGGHWNTEIGDVLRLGASYVNLHQTNSRYDSKDTSLKGAVSVSRPEFIYILFADDSPEDGFGAKVFGAPQMYVNGQLSDVKPAEMYPYPVSANGTSVIVFKFKIPRDANSISFRAVVANDYMVAMLHEFYEDPASPDYLVQTNYKIMERAPGNVKDESNKRVVILDYSLDTGRSIYGIDFSANILGLRLKGEYNTNLSYSKYPVLPGETYTQTSHAYFLQGKRKFGPLTLGGEVFQIDPNYQTSLNTFSRERWMSGQEDDLADSYNAAAVGSDLPDSVLTYIQPRVNLMGSVIFKEISIESPIEEKVRWAENCYKTNKDFFLADDRVNELLIKFKKAAELSHISMKEEGVEEQCRGCVEMEGGSCCGKGLEDRYSGVLILINFLLEMKIPSKRYDPKGCFFLSDRGCSLLARHVICINYVCKKITDRIEPEKMARLRDREGVELEHLFFLNERIKAVVRKIGASPH